MARNHAVPASEVAAHTRETLCAFLSDPGRPQGTLSYDGVQGFLFAVAAAPDLVPPSEWLPIIFDEASAGYRNLAEAQVVMPALLWLYNTIVAGVNEHRAGLPADCRFRRATLANLDEDAPVSQWSRGFVRGYSWLKSSWTCPFRKRWSGTLDRF